MSKPSDYKTLVRKLSDALLTVRPLGGSELFMRVGDEFYADPVVCTAEIKKLRDDLHKARAENALLRSRNISEPHGDVVNAPRRSV